MSIVRSFIPENLPNNLGRWRIDYCKVKTNNKVDLANEDHCGSCSEYALDKINVINKEREIKETTSNL
jgi:hypothetical protein